MVAGGFLGLVSSFGRGEYEFCHFAFLNNACNFFWEGEGEGEWGEPFIDPTEANILFRVLEFLLLFCLYVFLGGSKQ